MTPDFTTLRDQIVKKEIKGMFRTGWQMDYPSIENFLAPLYATGASSNDGEYSNPKFDAKLTRGRCGADVRRGEQAVPGGRGHPGQGSPGDTDVVLRPGIWAGLIE